MKSKSQNVMKKNRKCILGALEGLLIVGLVTLMGCQKFGIGRDRPGTLETRAAIDSAGSSAQSAGSETTLTSAKDPAATFFAQSNEVCFHSGQVDENGSAAWLKISKPRAPAKGLEKISVEFQGSCSNFQKTALHGTFAGDQFFFESEGAKATQLAGSAALVASLVYDRISGEKVAKVPALQIDVLEGKASAYCGEVETSWAQVSDGKTEDLVNEMSEFQLTSDQIPDYKMSLADCSQMPAATDVLSNANLQYSSFLKANLSASEKSADGHLYESFLGEEDREKVAPEGDEDASSDEEEEDDEEEDPAAIVSSALAGTTAVTTGASSSVEASAATRQPEQCTLSPTKSELAPTVCEQAPAALNAQPNRAGTYEKSERLDRRLGLTDSSRFAELVVRSLSWEKAKRKQLIDRIAALDRIVQSWNADLSQVIATESLSANQNSWIQARKASQELRQKYGAQGMRRCTSSLGAKSARCGRILPAVVASPGITKVLKKLREKNPESRIMVDTYGSQCWISLNSCTNPSSYRVNFSEQGPSWDGNPALREECRASLEESLKSPRMFRVKKIKGRELVSTYGKCPIKDGFSSKVFRKP